MSPRQRYRNTDPRRLTPDGALITPRKLTFSSDLDDTQIIPSAPTRKSVRVKGRAGGQIVLRVKALNGETPRSPLSELSIEVTRKSSPLGILQIFPNEILVNIASKLEEGALELHYQRVQDFGLVCLALTSADFYKICKSVHPAPLPTRRGDGMRDEYHHFWSWSLERYIGDFLGPSYKVRERDPRYSFYTRIGSPFLLRDRKPDDKDLQDVYVVRA